MKAMNLIILLLLAGVLSFQNALGQPLTGTRIIEKVDENMSSENRVMESAMIIHGKRRDRTITSKTWSVGTSQSFSEYLSPAREGRYQNAEGRGPVVDLYSANRPDHSNLRPFAAAIGDGVGYVL